MQHRASVGVAAGRPGPIGGVYSDHMAEFMRYRSPPDSGRARRGQVRIRWALEIVSYFERAGYGQARHRQRSQGVISPADATQDHDAVYVAEVDMIDAGCSVGHILNEGLVALDGITVTFGIEADK